ncbi:MAG: hypothetical protein K9J30_04685 [Bacteroidales bacterium]|nr:hypothetical protein [Bacteroidales bacterium]
MNRIPIAILFVFLMVPDANLDAQDPVDRIWSQVDSIEQQAGSDEFNNPKSPFSYNTVLGTSIGFAPSMGSMMQYYASPRGTYSINNRVGLHGGFFVSHSVSHAGYFSNEAPETSGLSTFSTYVSASYRLTDRLVVHGTGVKGIVTTPWIEDRPYVNFHDLSIGATYDFGNFSIGASFHRSDNVLYQTPFDFGNSVWY